MADTIKTQIMKGLKEAFETIPEVKTVFRYPTAGLDLDVVPTPVLFFYDDDEDREKRNRLMLGKLRLIVGVYLPLLTSNTVDASDLADTIQARIHTLMATHSVTGNPLIQMIEEQSFTKDYPNAEFILLVGVFQVYYQHKYGDGFSNTDY